MAFTIPTETFNALEHARNKAIGSNQFTDGVLTQFKGTFEEFWGVSGSDQSVPVKDAEGNPVLDSEGNETTEIIFVGEGSRYSLAEMQSIIDSLGAVLMEIMTQSSAFTDFLNTAYPGVLAGRYQQAGFDYTIDQSNVVLTGVNAAWAANLQDRE
jgi:hypothetical protein